MLAADPLLAWLEEAVTFIKEPRVRVPASQLKPARIEPRGKFIKFIVRNARSSSAASLEVAARSR